MQFGICNQFGRRSIYWPRSIWDPVSLALHLARIRSPQSERRCIPKGFWLKAQGCESASYPGKRSARPTTPTGLWPGSKAASTGRATTFSRLTLALNRAPRVARRLATLGFEAQSLRDWVCAQGAVSLLPLSMAGDLRKSAASHTHSNRFASLVATGRAGSRGLSTLVFPVRDAWPVISLG
jgi:hypothetical protein